MKLSFIKDKIIYYDTVTYQDINEALINTIIVTNTGDSIAYILATVHFRYPKLSSFSVMEYYFYQLAYRDLKVPKHFVGLNQIQCSPSFDWNWGKQNDSTACWHQLHLRFQVLQQGKCHQSTWAGSLNCKLRGWRGGYAAFKPPLMGDTPFKIPPVLVI